MNALTDDFYTISRRSLVACRTAFFLPGVAMGAWAPLVPFARERAGIGDGELGILLLCLGTGSLCMMPFVAKIVSKVGCRATMITALLGAIISLMFLASVSQFSLLVVFLLIFGACLGTADVTMNLQGSIVERGLGRSMMSGFHGLFSVGNIVSALVVSGLLWCGLSPVEAVFALVALVIALLLGVGRHMLPYGEGSGGSMFAKPTPYVLLLGVLCLIAFLVEGSMLDWSAVFLNTVRGMDISHSGIGFALFSVTMAIGRLSGDWLVPKLTERVVLLGGGCVALVGVMIAILVDNPFATLAGFVLIGAGIANLVPVYCSAAGKQGAMPVAMALSTVNAIGYLGILMGPAVIGFVAHLTTLSIALLLTGILLVFVIATSRTVVKQS
ncbi:MFS transporter [Pseudomonas sp. B21-031]|uniref:MFS transporter n=1 Tax=Pseudomonas sp. B21-031 TaxID=2895482 RepID=UPI00215EB122|nr:MFS transporter [Pseudomonas sp. B21-031]UVL65155.1 MFS transporter [Pseudomonas sp. B21-031]